MCPVTRAYVGLRRNLGDREATIRKAAQKSEHAFSTSRETSPGGRTSDFSWVAEVERI